MHEEVQKLVDSGKLTTKVGLAISRLEPGVFCSHRSWGVGRVASWDLLGDRIYIDFEGKPGHGMKLEFAAKSLEILPEGHILARRFVDLKGLQALARDDPAALVRQVLRSYEGELLLDHFDNVVKGTIVDEAKYKNWWDSTKKKLRTDRAFVVPPKRNVPLQVRGDDVDPAECLREEFTAARDLKSKVANLQRIVREIDVFDEGGEHLEAIVAHLDETAARNQRVQPSFVLDILIGRDVLLARHPELAKEAPEDRVSVKKILEDHGKRLGALLAPLTGTSLRQAFEEVEKSFAEDWGDRLLAAMASFGSRGVVETARFFSEKNKEDAWLEFLSAGLRQRSLSAEALGWICRERQKAAKEIFEPEMFAALINSLERDHYDDNNKKPNRLGDLLLDDPNLITDLLEGADLNQVRMWARRILMTPVFDELNRRSLLARFVKARPEIEEVVSGEGGEEVEEALIVSWVSLERKKEQFEDLVRNRIPANSREIAIARDYGDLRENFEFKAAKDMQAVLMRQKAEMEHELAIARGTDFRGTETSQVSVGTVVHLRNRESGGEEVYTILGAWDTDVTKGIISYLSAAGDALLGHSAGDEVNLPGEDGTAQRPFLIESIDSYTA